MTKEYLKNKKYFPTLVENKIKGRENIVQKINKLPKKQKDILYSDEISKIVFLVEKKYNLSDYQTEEFSRSIREFFLQEITKKQFITQNSRLCKANEKEIENILQNIISIEVEQKKQKELEKITLEQAIQKYPKILNQIITSKKIITKPFIKPLVPTVKNWIMVYEKKIGVKKHDSIERGEFVFRSDATRGLTNMERNRLLILFKSRDENSKIYINSEENRIVFKINEKKINYIKKNVKKEVNNNTKNNKNNNNQKIKNNTINGKITFSSNHVLPVEKNKK
jgi:NADH:ubiquinone oxidoreductase subunit